MAHVSEHHSEKERKCYTRINGRVNLLVGRYSISVDNLLINLSKFICFNVSWGLNFLKRNFFQVDLKLLRVVRRCDSVFMFLPIISSKKLEFFKW
jgi:hypothetical protein